MQFCFERFIPVSQERLFAFHEDPAHLLWLHRGWCDLRLLHHAGNVHPGSLLWVELNIAHILPVVLGFRHTVYDPPRCFAEELIHGPFSRFSHSHQFEVRGAGTIVRDVLTVELPLQYGGEPAMKTLIAPTLHRAFAHRADALERIVQADFAEPI